MCRDEFNSQMKRLVNNYGASKYQEERSERIWKHFYSTGIPRILFEGIVDQAIDECLQAPLLPKLIAMADKRIKAWRASAENFRNDILSNPPEILSHDEYLTGKEIKARIDKIKNNTGCDHNWVAPREMGTPYICMNCGEDKL